MSILIWILLIILALVLVVALVSAFLKSIKFFVYGAAILVSGGIIIWALLGLLGVI